MAKSSARSLATDISSAARPWYPSEFTAEERDALGGMLSRHLPHWLRRSIEGRDDTQAPKPRLVPVDSKDFAERVAYAFDQLVGFGALSRCDDDESPAMIARARERLHRALRMFSPGALFELLGAFEPETRQEPSARAERRGEEGWRTRSAPILAEWLLYFRARMAASRAIADSIAISDAQRARFGGVMPSSGLFGYLESVLAADRDDAARVVAALDGRLKRVASRIAEADEMERPRPFPLWRYRRRGASHRREAVAVLHAGLSQVGFGQREIASLVCESSTWMVPPCPAYIAAKSKRDGDPKDRIAWEIGKDLRVPGKKRAVRAP